eukprot:982247_1
MYLDQSFDRVDFSVEIGIHDRSLPVPVLKLKNSSKTTSQLMSLRVLGNFILFLILSHAKAKPSDDVCDASDTDCDSIKNNPNKKRRIIFDSDPGLDDAFALLWLLEGFKNELYSLEALTIVEGNISPFHAYRNTMHMINLTTPASSSETRALRKKLKSIPIGKVDPSEDEDKSIETFFGGDGFNGVSSMFKEFPNVFASMSKVKKWFNNPDRTPFSDDLIIEKLLKYPNQISILSVGPVTNLYRAERKHPGILALAKDIYIMGGTFRKGNADALTEFNFKRDSESLYEVFDVINTMHGNGSRVPNVFVFPLDVTGTLKWNVEQFELLYSLLDGMKQSEIEMCRMRIDGVDDDVQQMYDVQEEDVYCTQTGLMYQFLEKATERQIVAHFETGIGDYMELHDLSLIGFMLYPHLFDFKYVKCNIDKGSGLIWFDKRLQKPTAEGIAIPNCLVAHKVDEEQFVRVFTRDMMFMLNEL